MSRPAFIVDLASSVRVTIALCILLALVSFVGTVVPQNLNLDQYEGLYGRTGSTIVSWLSISDIYHTPCFVILLGLLAVNLVACTAKRFPVVWRAVRRDASLPARGEFSKWRNRDSFSLEVPRQGGEDALVRSVTEIFGGRHKQGISDSGKRLLLFEKYRFSRVGPYLAHTGILLILLGGLVGAWFGFRGTMILPEGERQGSLLLDKGRRQVPLGFEVRCDRFVMETYPNGMPKEYRSSISILNDKGEVLREADIRVNHPLTFSGITLYQYTYGSIDAFSLEVQDRKTGETTPVETQLREPFPLPGHGGDMGVTVNFTKNMKIPMEMAKIARFSRQDLGPAVQVRVFRNAEGFGNPFWVFQEFPERDEERGGEYVFRLKGVESIPYSGLQVTHDPGTPLVWTGCLLLVVGFILSFLFDHEILCVSLEPLGDGRVLIYLAGRAVRHPGVYSGRFETRRARIRKKLGISLSDQDTISSGCSTNG